MNTLEAKIQKDLVSAMKGEPGPWLAVLREDAVAALRSIKTAITETKTAPNGKRELEDDDIVKVIQRLVKQRQESIDIYSQAGRDKLADKERAEMFILKTYLPKMLTQEELEKAIDDIMAELEATTMKDMGKVMKALGSKYPNQYDGKTASTYIKNKLS